MSSVRPRIFNSEHTAPQATRSASRPSIRPPRHRLQLRIDAPRFGDHLGVGETPVRQRRPVDRAPVGMPCHRSRRRGMPVYRTPGHLPATRCTVIGAARPGRAESLRSGRHQRARQIGCSRGAHPPATSDRPPGQRRPDRPRDRRPALPLTAHGQLAPVPVLSQARGGQPPPATRRYRPLQHTTASTRGTRLSHKRDGWHIVVPQSQLTLCQSCAIVVPWTSRRTWTSSAPNWR
jgi:hypothetical protein